MTLTLSTGSFDQTNTFEVEFLGVRGKLRRKTCSLMLDYKKPGDGIFWGVSACSVLKDVYTDADVAERERLAAQEPVRHGDVVTIQGKPFTARVLGDFSDAVIFDAV